MKPAFFFPVIVSAARGLAFFSVLFTLTISGCVRFPGSGGNVSAGAPALVLGEHVAYRIVNRLPHPQPAVQMPVLTDSAGRLLYANLQAASEQFAAPVGFGYVGSALPASVRFPASTRFEKDPGDENLVLPPSHARAMVVAPGGHRVPDTVYLAWRELPRPGQTVYSGAAVRPVSVSLRSQIPATVLARVRDQWRYRLDIEVIALPDAAQLRWRLLFFTDDAVQEIHRGGRWPS